MSEQRYVVPEEGFKAAFNEFFNAASLNGRTSITDGERLEYALEAFIRWQSEYGPVPTYEEMRQIRNDTAEGDQSTDFGARVVNLIREWQRRMYLAPLEPAFEQRCLNCGQALPSTLGKTEPSSPKPTLADCDAITNERARGWVAAKSAAQENVPMTVPFVYAPARSAVPEEIKDAKRLVLAVWPGATAMPDASGTPSADYCIVRPATKEDWPENKWVQVGPYVSGDPWEVTASLLRGQREKERGGQ